MRMYIIRRCSSETPGDCTTAEEDNSMKADHEIKNVKTSTTDEDIPVSTTQIIDFLVSVV